MEGKASILRVADLPLGNRMRLTPQQKVLVALDLNNRSLDMKDLSHSTRLAWAQVNKVVREMRGNEIECDETRKPKKYSLGNRSKGLARLLRLSLVGPSIEDITIGRPTHLKTEVFDGEKFREGLRHIMDLILETLPTVNECSKRAILNIEEDPCFEKSIIKEHWFYCHGISTKLQAELGKESVKDWVKQCNERGIGEVVINDVSFATGHTWEDMLPLKSHEYWLTYEPPRPEGYIAFGNRVALLAWEKARCVLHTDNGLARIFRNNVKIMRLNCVITTRCCPEHRQFNGHPDASVYQRMWT